MVAERRMRPIPGKGGITPEKALHVRRVENNTIKLTVAVGQMAAINPGL